MSEDGNSTHSEYFAEAYVALRLGSRGHRIPHRTQPLAFSYRIKNHIRLEQTITLKITELTVAGYFIPTYVQVTSIKVH